MKVVLTVYGCADVTSLSNAWVRRHGDQIVVTCNYTGEVYYVTCDDNHWPLELINCTRGQKCYQPWRFLYIHVMIYVCLAVCMYVLL